MRLTQIVAVLAIALATTGAQGQGWDELGDAPEGVPDHQDTVGVGPLNSIVGSLDAVKDHVDTYSIEVTESVIVHGDGEFDDRRSPCQRTSVAVDRRHAWRPGAGHGQR